MAQMFKEVKEAGQATAQLLQSGSTSGRHLTFADDLISSADGSPASPRGGRASSSRLAVASMRRTADDVALADPLRLSSDRKRRSMEGILLPPVPPVSQEHVRTAYERPSIRTSAFYRAAPIAFQAVSEPPSTALAQDPDLGQLTVSFDDHFLMI